MNEHHAVVCACGCGGEIPWKPHHNQRPPKYLQGHFSKTGRAGRKRYTPTPDEIPSGICECGCGASTPIVTGPQNRKRRHFTGHPMPYIRGHSAPLKGAAHHLWKGGRYISSEGYVQAYAPNHPAASKGYVREHRLVMEANLGRYLATGEEVHHINGKRDDNRLENLVVLTRSQHRAAHRESHGALMRQWHKDHPEHASKMGRASHAARAARS